MAPPLMQAVRRKKETRTIVTIIVLILLVVGLGQFSLSRLENLHNLMTEIASGQIQSLRMLNEIAADSERLRNLQTLNLLVKDTPVNEGILRRMDLVQTLRDDLWKKNVTAYTGPDDVKIVDITEKAWQEYMALAGQARSLHDAGQEAQAIAFFNTEAQLAMDRYRAAFRTYRDHVTSQAQQKLSEGDTLYSESRVVILYVFLFAVPMCLLASVSIVSLRL